MENRIKSQNLEGFLGLDSPPIAIKIVKTEDPLPKVKEPIQRSRCCQLLILARKGQTLMLNAEKISTGEILCTLRLFVSKEAAAKTMSMIPRKKLGSTKAVVAGPLGFPYGTRCYRG